LTTDGHAGQRYDLTSEDAFTAGELAALLSKALGRAVEPFGGDAGTMRAALLDSGAPEVLAALMEGYFKTVAERCWHDTDTARRLLGRRPRPYAEWLERNLPAIVAGSRS